MRGCFVCDGVVGCALPSPPATPPSRVGALVWATLRARGVAKSARQREHDDDDNGVMVVDVIIIVLLSSSL